MWVKGMWCRARVLQGLVRDLDKSIDWREDEMDHRRGQLMTQLKKGRGGGVYSTCEGFFSNRNGDTLI